MFVKITLNYTKKTQLNLEKNIIQMMVKNKKSKNN